MKNKIKAFVFISVIAISFCAQADNVLGNIGPFILSQPLKKSLQLTNCSDDTTDLAFYVKQTGSTRLHHRQYISFTNLILEYSNGYQETINGDHVGKVHRFLIEIDQQRGCPSKVYLTAKNFRYVSGKPSSVTIKISQNTNNNK